MPPKKPPIWDDAQRAEVGAEHRRASQSEVTTTAIVARAIDPDEEHTKPHDLLEMGPDGPVSVKQMLELWGSLDKMKTEERRARRQTADQVLDIAAHPDKVKLNALDAKMKVVWYLLAGALSLAGANAIAVAKSLYSSGGDDRELHLTIKNLVEEHTDYEKRIRKLEDELLMSRRRRDQPDPPYLISPSPQPQKVGP